MRLRYCARAPLVVLGQQREIASDDIAVLDADRRDQLTRTVDALDVVRRVRDLDEIRVHPLGHAVDGVELGDRPFAGLLVPFGCSARLAHVDDEEADVQSARAHLLQVHLAVGVERVDGIGGEVEGNVVVRVDRQHVVVDAPGARLHPDADVVLRRDRLLVGRGAGSEGCQ